LLNQAGEVMTSRLRMDNNVTSLRQSLSDLSGNLERLRQQLRELDLQAELQMQSRMAQTRESELAFDPLEFDRFTRVQELTRMLAESVDDVATVQRNLGRSLDAAETDLANQARQARDLQRDLLRTRMVEFESLSERLYRVVRQAGKDTGKRVQMDIEGGAIEIDRSVLDRMTPAFEHLLRNAVAHGVESIEQRLAAGKAEAGSITIVLQQEGNDVAISFVDDGAGFDLNRIRERALALGLQPEGASDVAPENWTEAQLISLVFHAGLSTADQVSALAGRGIGMDVVRADVNALGGRIEAHSVRGQGSRFKLVLPLTTAITQVVMLRVGQQVMGVPASLIERVRRESLATLAQAQRTGEFITSAGPVPYFWAGALLRDSAHSQEIGQGKTAQVVLVRSAAQTVALHVDEVLGNKEVVVKNLGPQLSRIPGLAGLSIMPDGEVALIYNPVALAQVYGESVRSWQAQMDAPVLLPDAAGASAAAVPEAVVDQAPLVMVVDDSITVRRVTQRLLQREGFRVVLAYDGMQALEKLIEERPSVILSDIEMPRMDGFDLVRNLKANDDWAQLPVIMITSRIAEKHRARAQELGVQHYLGKPYSEDELLQLIRHYTHDSQALHVEQPV
jgi:chemosensory pili system protein ChpA (sensor histidine kinase/response regulator)